jgi:hypothetical protein
MKSTIDMAREAGFETMITRGETFTFCFDRDGVCTEELKTFEALVRADAIAEERAALMQLFTDPENQPTQHGTVTVEYMQREVAAEREACAKVCEDNALSSQYGERSKYRELLTAVIRARSNT